LNNLQHLCVKINRQNFFFFFQNIIFKNQVRF
jgi:hypothetical protein